MAGPQTVTITGIGESQWIKFNRSPNPTQISVGCIVSGVATYEWDWAYESPAQTAVPDPVVQGLTVNAVATSGDAVTYGRLKITVGTGSVTANIIQAGVTTGVATAAGIPTELSQTGVGSSRWVPFDPSVTPINITVACSISGTGTYSVEWAYDQPATAAYADNVVSGVAANALAQISRPVMFGRITVLTGSIVVVATFLQSGANSNVVPAPRTTSGNISFNPSARQIIEEAFSLIRVGTNGEPLDAADAQQGMRTLNLMVKAWMADGLHLWTKEEGVLFLESGTPQYGLGGNTEARSCLYSDLTASWLTADALAGDSVITIDDPGEIENGAAIAVEIGGNLLQWNTVNGNPVGNLIRLTYPLDEDVSANAAVFSYSEKLVRPTRLLQARRRIFAPDRQDWNDIWLTILERPAYFEQPTKQQAGTETMIYYSPQLVTGLMYLWQAPSNETDLVLFTFERPLQDFTALTQTADFPQEWIETLAYNLAFRLAFKYSFPLDERTQLGIIAEGMKQKLLSFDREYGSVNFQPDFSQGGGYAPIRGIR